MGNKMMKILKPQKKILLASDFDGTISLENTDGAVQTLYSIPAEIRMQGREGKLVWPDYMQLIFDYLHTKDVKEDTYKRIPIVPGFDTVLQKVGEQPDKYETIIISDSNELFINWWLESKGITTVNAVFSNKAYFPEEGGPLQIRWYHDPPMEKCPLKDSNLCKGQIMRAYIKKRRKEGVKFTKVVYAGDGRNDVCAVLHLKKKDVAFARKNFSLYEMLTKPAFRKEAKPKCKTWFAWEQGEEVLAGLGLAESGGTRIEPATDPADIPGPSHAPPN